MIFAAIFTAYVLTFIVASSDVLHRPRKFVKILTPSLVFNRKHLLDCRMCVGFWLSIGITYGYALMPWDFFIVYGASYFLATQERIS